VIPFLSEQWAAEYRADLLARLQWELDAGWRTVSAIPEPEGPAHHQCRVQVPRPAVGAVERVRFHRPAYLRVVA
jgi:hypothetical protein